MNSENTCEVREALPLEISLTQLAHFSATLPPIYQAMEPQLFHLTLQEIKKHQQFKGSIVKNGQEKKKKLLVQEKWLQLQVSGAWQQLSPRELRAFLIVEDAVLNREYLEKLAPQCSESRTAFREVLTAYFRFWQHIHEKGVVALKAQWRMMLTQGFIQPSFPTERWEAYQYWKLQCPWLLTDEAPIALAKLLFTRTDALNILINECLMLNATIAVDSILIPVRQVLLAEVLQQPVAPLKNGLLRQAIEQWMLPVLDTRFLSSLILHVHSLGDATLRDELKSWFLRHEQFGDPRLNPTRWNTMQPEALAVFRGWLSQADLKFFFEFALDSRDDEHGRKAFWLKYLSHVINSRILITDEFRWLKAEQLKKLKSEGEIQTDVLGIISGSNTFIMETKTHYIVEFAQKGNAAYLYDKRDQRYQDVIKYIKSLLSLEKITEQKIRRSNIPQITQSNPLYNEITIRCVHRDSINPNYGWQYHLENWLRNHGIKPIEIL